MWYEICVLLGFGSVGECLPIAEFVFKWILQKKCFLLEFKGVMTHINVQSADCHYRSDIFRYKLGANLISSTCQIVFPKTDSRLL